MFVKSIWNIYQLFVYIVVFFTYISVDESRKCLEDYIKAVDREITKRRQVKDLLEQAKKYYSSLYDEAEVVTNVSYILIT